MHIQSTGDNPQKQFSTPLTQDTLSRKMVFVSGKGGVGKTALSQALAQALSELKLRTLWTTFEDPFLPRGKVQVIGPFLSHLNCDPTQAFEEYATMKLGAGKIVQFFIKNRLISYLAQAAPGFHELVLLGKVWYERNHFDVVICDMPSTGYGLTMFQATQNFSELFAHSPVQGDAEAMLRTFGSAKESLHLIVALPEEMPLQEGLELAQYLKNIFPNNPPGFLINRLFPSLKPNQPPMSSSLAFTGPSFGQASNSQSPLAFTAEEYIENRRVLESKNIECWSNAGIDLICFNYALPSLDLSEQLVDNWKGVLTPPPVGIESGPLEPSKQGEATG